MSPWAQDLRPIGLLQAKARVGGEAEPQSGEEWGVKRVRDGGEEGGFLIRRRRRKPDGRRPRQRWLPGKRPRSEERHLRVGRAGLAGARAVPSPAGHAHAGAGTGSRPSRSIVPLGLHDRNATALRGASARSRHRRRSHGRAPCGLGPSVWGRLTPVRLCERRVTQAGGPKARPPDLGACSQHRVRVRRASDMPATWAKTPKTHFPAVLK